MYELIFCVMLMCSDISFTSPLMHICCFHSSYMVSYLLLLSNNLVITDFSLILHHICNLVYG